MTGPRSKFRGVATELAIVVIGILIALAVDQALERRDEGRLENEYLRAMSQDVNQTLAWLTDLGPRVIDWRVQAALAIDSIGAGHVPVQDTLRLVYDVLSVGASLQTAVATTTVEDLTSTGNLRLLEPRVRAGTVQYELMAESVQEVDASLAERLRNTSEDLSPVVDPHVASIVSEVAWNSMPPWPPYEAIVLPAELRSLVASGDVPARLRSVENLSGSLNVTIQEYRGLAFWYSSSASVARELLRLIEASLAAGAS